MNPWLVWTATFVAGALGAALGTKLGQRGPLARVRRLEAIAHQTAETMIVMTENIVRLSIDDALDSETKERIRVRIVGEESDNGKA